MLRTLQVHNFALLEDATVEFAEGFNVFTGETGAGKSILIDAFGIVLGDRASTGFIRRGADSFWVQAVFECNDDVRVSQFLAAQGIDEDENLFIKRRVALTGKSQGSINGIQVPIAVIRELAKLLVDIHGQHENQTLLQPSAPRQIVDKFGGKPAAELLEKYRRSFEKWKDVRENLRLLSEKNNGKDILLDRLKWEINEIEQADITPGEEEKLRAENRFLQNIEKVLSNVAEAHELLESDGGALDILAKTRQAIDNACRYDGRLKEISKGLESAWISADDVRSGIKDYVDSQVYDATRAKKIQDRLDLFYRLKKKYGSDESEILNYLNESKQECNKLLKLDESIRLAEKEEERTRYAARELAQELHDLRVENANIFCERIIDHLHDLSMPDGTFKIKFFTTEELAPEGVDMMQFEFSANSGEPLQPLIKVASGGELSRLALAVKTVFSKTDEKHTMVFDEIDTGVGGVTAQKMAEKLLTIGERNQVLCITHLPQIAAFADRHILIRKVSSNGRTVTLLTVLSDEQKVDEIMRMSAGAIVTDAARENAKEILKAAGDFKRDHLKLQRTLF